MIRADFTPNGKLELTAGSPAETYALKCWAATLRTHKLASILGFYEDYPVRQVADGRAVMPQRLITDDYGAECLVVTDGANHPVLIVKGTP